MDERCATPILFEDLFDKPTTVSFNEPCTSSNGGAVLLNAIAQKMGIINAFTEHIDDTRQEGKVQHTIEELVQQRIFTIACGYPDCNDAAKLADDPIIKLLVGQERQDDESLASQPTLSRFENSIDFRALFQIGCTLGQHVIDYQCQRRRGKRRPKRITIDMDPTDDPTHGQQAFTFFNGHYDSWCYLPLTVFITFDDEPQQYLVGTILRPGNAPATLDASWVLRRLTEALRKAWPKVKIRARLDGGFASPRIFDLLESLNVEYYVAIAKNSRLNAFSAPLMKKVRRLQRKEGGTQRLYGECHYAARSWKRQERRVIFKAEIVAHPGRSPRDNCRFVVTNARCKPERVYQRYRGRGDVENRIKELQYGMQIDRTSCHNFEANAFRVLLTTAGFMLFQAMRDRITDSELRHGQVGTLRERLLKVAARVKVTCRRIYISFPHAFPDVGVFVQLARSLGAVTAQGP